MRKKPVTKEQLIERQRVIIAHFCKHAPQSCWIREERWDELQDWICNNLSAEFSYATGLSIMEAATIITESQIENGMEELVD